MGLEKAQKERYRVKVYTRCPVCDELVRVRWWFQARRVWMAKSDPAHKHEFRWFTFEPPGEKKII